MLVPGIKNENSNQIPFLDNENNKIRVHNHKLKKKCEVHKLTGIYVDLPRTSLHPHLSMQPPISRETNLHYMKKTFNNEKRNYVGS